MALKNSPVSGKKKDKVILSNKQIKQIQNKIEQAEDIYFGELALSRINDKNDIRMSSEEVKAALGL
ncbi:MAG: hypothetical protein H7263_03510 [Candidatus Sericytochromatia bacterium]|nr:hypothetical protein [Candidatus Sericytochromatia bacterium]